MRDAKAFAKTLEQLARSNPDEGMRLLERRGWVQEVKALPTPRRTVDRREVGTRAAIGALAGLVSGRGLGGAVLGAVQGAANYEMRGAQRLEVKRYVTRDGQAIGDKADFLRKTAQHARQWAQGVSL